MPKQYSLLRIFSLCFVLSIAATSLSTNEIKIDSIDARVITTLDPDTLSMEGNVMIKTEQLEFWSDKAVYNKRKKTIALEGSIRVLSKNLEISAREMEANLLERTFYITETSFTFMKNNFGGADSIRVFTNEKVELLNTSINSCSVEDPAWELNANNLTLLENGRNAVVRGVTLKIKDIPILYIPYIRTAIGKEKFSGFLSPSLKQGRDGIDISLPYFINLAPNYDLTLSPRYIEERGAGIATEFRYLTKTTEGGIVTSNIFQDRKFANETNYRGDRWMAQWSHKSQLGSSLFLNVNTEGVSDNFFFENLNEDILGTKQKNYLTNRLNVKWIGKTLKVEGEIRQYKDLNPFASGQYETRPNISINFQDKFNGLNFNLFSNYTKFAFDKSYNPFNKEKEIKRKTVEPSLSYSQHFVSSSFSIGIGSENIRHDTNSLSLDRTTNWVEGEYKIFFESKSNESLKSLNPSLKFIKLDADSYPSVSIDSRLMSLNYNNLFLRNWYSGPDRILSEDRVILGIEHQNLGLQNDMNLILLFGKAFFLDKGYSLDGKNKKNSPLIIEFKHRLKGNFFSNGMLEIDSDFNKVYSSNFGLMYEHGESKRVELRSIYRRLNPYINNMPWLDSELPISQMEILTQWSISDKFSVFGKVQKDNEINESKDLSYGFQFTNCCMKVGLMKRKWKDQDYYSWYTNPKEAFKALQNNVNPEIERDNIYIFFELKDIGRIGKQIAEVISPTVLE